MQRSLNILVFGSGAREHAIADSVSRSTLLNKLYLAQSGAFNIGEVIEFSDFEDLAKKCVDKKIDIAVFGSEEPLCEGIVDVFKKHNISCIGANKEFSEIESSKLFGKSFMKNYGIKTAKYTVVTEEHLPDYDRLKFPLVIKADGLCGAKGVVIANNQSFAQNTINDFLGGKFGDNSKTILLEEFLQGEELSLVSLWDGKNILHFAPARIFKKLNKSLSASNTEGLGAFCAVKLNSFQQKKLDEYKKQLEKALIAEKPDFVGFICSDLIMAQKDRAWDWFVLEYNVHLPDPLAQAILTHLTTDFLEVLQSAVDKKLDKVKLEYNENYSACLVLACEGYPKTPRDGKKITLPEETSENRGIKIYNAGVEEIDGQLYSKGGRVLSLCTTSQDPFWELKNFAKEIEMENKYFRSDIEVN